MIELLRRRTAAGAVLLAGALAQHAPARAQADPADRAALDKAAASLKWLEAFTCPSLGVPLGVRGMQSDEEVAAQQQSSWSFAQTTLEGLRGPLQKREAVLRTAKKGDNYEAELARVDAQLTAAMARVGTALVNWSLANWVELSKVEAAYPYPAAGPHPLERFLQRDKQLGELVNIAGRLPGNEYLQSLAPKFHQCLLQSQNQVVERNADSIRSAANAMKSASEVAPIARSYGVVDASFAGPGVATPEVIRALHAQGEVLKERERVAAEAEANRLAALERAEEARKAGRPALAGQPAAAKPGGAPALPANLQAQVKVAAALVQALLGKSINDALKHMHHDITMSSPLGTAQGKPQVASALQRGFSQGGSGSLGQPTVIGGQVVASVQSARGNATMVFGFTDNLVSSLRIR